MFVDSSGNKLKLISTSAGFVVAKKEDDSPYYGEIFTCDPLPHIKFRDEQWFGEQEPTIPFEDIFPIGCSGEKAILLLPDAIVWLEYNEGWNIIKVTEGGFQPEYDH